MKLPLLSLGALLCELVIAPRAAYAADPVSLHIDATDPDLEVFDRTNQVAMVPVRVGRSDTTLERTYVFKPLCKAPCDVELEPGRHVLALSKQGGGVVEGDDVIHLNGPATVSASYTDRGSWRGAGLALALASTAVGVGLLWASLKTETVCSPGLPATTPGSGIPLSDGIPGSCSTFQTVDPAMMGASAGVLVGGLVAGLIMMLQPDAASFKITALTLSSLSPHHEGPLDALPNGVALSMRF
jgi:hypothetical protein